MRRAGVVGSLVLAMMAAMSLVSGAAVSHAATQGWDPAYSGPWSLTLISSRGEDSFHGRTLTLDSSNADLSISQVSASISIDARSRTDINDGFTIDFMANGGAPVLTEGFWRGVESRTELQIARGEGRTDPVLWFDWKGSNCPPDETQLDVRRLHRATDGDIDQMRVLFEQRCIGNSGALFGEFQMGLPTQPVDTRPAASIPGALPGTMSFETRSDPGDYVGEGRSFRTTDPTVFGMYGVPDRVSAWVDGWDLIFTPPPGGTLRPGTYSGAHRWPYNDSSPGMAVTSGYGSACNTIDGSFTIHQAWYDARQRLRHLDISFEQRCDGNWAALRGRLKFQATSDVRGPRAVSRVVARRYPGRITLHWANPTNRDFARTVVRWYSGSGPAARLTDVGFAGRRTSARTAVIDQPDPGPVTVSLIPIDRTGNLGDIKVVRVPGR